MRAETGYKGPEKLNSGCHFMKSQRLSFLVFYPYSDTGEGSVGSTGSPVVVVVVVKDLGLPKIISSKCETALSILMYGLVIWEDEAVSLI